MAALRVGTAKRHGLYRAARPGESRRRSVDRRAALAVAVREVDRAAQLLERARLDLADALAGDAEVVPRLLQRPGDAVVEAVADADHLLLALAQRAQQPVDL